MRSQEMTGNKRNYNRDPATFSEMSAEEIEPVRKRASSKVNLPNGFPKNAVPPDGGWGWMVLLGTMTVNIVVIGHGKSFGVYFKNLMEEFDATPSRVAWLQSLQISMFSFLSPVASVLAQVIGPRKVAVFGGLVGFFGLTISAFAPSLEYLYVSYGVLQGIALTCTFTPGITMIAKYFYHRRGLANGLTMAGNAIGGIILPLIATELISEYSVRGCFLVMGSLILHSCVGASLWQPVEWHQKQQPVIVRNMNENPEQEPLEVGDSCGEDTLCSDEEYRDNSVQDDVSIVNKDILTEDINFESGLDLSLNNSLANKVNGPEIVIDRKNSTQYSSGPNLRINSLSPKTLNHYLVRGGSSPHLADVPKLNDRTYNSSVSTESLPNLLGLNPKLMNSRASSFMYLSSYSFGPTSGAVLTREHFTSADSSETSDTPEKKCDVEKPKKWKLSPCLKKLAIDKSIFENSRFYIMTVTLFFHALGYPGTQIFLPYRATSIGFSQGEAASLLSVLAFTDLIGRIFCAWISDFQFCPRKYYFIGGLLMSGAFAFTLPFCKTYISLMAATAALGFCCGAYIGLVVVMFADAYSPEKVALAYSISVVSGGFMSLSGPPLMGYVLETTGSYLICQIILGSAQVAAATVWLAEPWFLRWEKRRQVEQDSVVNSPEKQQLV